MYPILLACNVYIIIVIVGPKERSYSPLLSQRLRDAGAFLTTSESVVFELLGDSKHPHFKEVQALVKTAAPDSGLLTKL